MEKDYSKYFTRPSMNDARKRKSKNTNYIPYNIDDSLEGIGKGKQYLIQTYGCQGNEADSETIAGILEQLGFSRAKKISDADIILLNTCAIRENAENRVFGELGRLKRYKTDNPDLLLGVCGCMPQEEKVTEKLLMKYPYVDLVFGTHNIYKLPEYLHSAYFAKERVIEVWSMEGNIIENLPKKRDHKYKAWVNIMFGCDEFCTYCIVPFTRGKERSREPNEIINEVQKLAEKGYKEVTLLGQNVNAYGKDFQDKTYTFANLLSDLSETKMSRIRFTTSHPRDLDDQTIEVMSIGKNIMPHLHLPVQSGSNDILKKMNRKYTKETYIELIRKLREKIPHISLTTDIIVGFPGETEEDFQETLDLVKQVDFEGAYTFVFSPRAGTPAMKYTDDTPLKAKKDRLFRLNELINLGYLKGNKRFENETIKVLVDGTSKNDDSVLSGYSEHNKLVNFVGDKKYIGSIVNVHIVEAKTWHLKGKIVE